MASNVAKTATTELKPELGKKRKPPRSAGIANLFTYNNQMELTFSHSTKNTRTSLTIDSSDEEDDEFVNDTPEFTRISEDEEEDDDELFADDSKDSVHITDSEESFVEKPSRHNRSPSPPPPPPSQAELLRVQRQLRAKDKKARDFDVEFGRLKQLVATDVCSPVTTTVRKSTEIISLDDTPSPVVVRNRADRKMTVKVRTRSGIKRFDMKAGDKFEVILKDLADSQNVPVENILLSLKHNNILSEDTPLSKGVSVADILECVVMESCAVVDEENTIEIKVQGNDASSRKTFTVSKTKPLESLFAEYAKFRKMPKSKLKFLFDGDVLKGKETPEDLDMEDENVIDVQVLK